MLCLLYISADSDLAKASFLNEYFYSVYQIILDDIDHPSMISELNIVVVYIWWWSA